MSLRIFFYFSCLQNFMPDHMRQRMTFFISKYVLKICVTKPYIFHTKWPFWPNFKLPKNPYLPIEMTQKKYNEVEFENTFRLLKNKKVMVTRR